MYDAYFHMQRNQIGLFLSLCIFICKVYSRVHRHKSEDEQIEADLQRLILRENQKTGIFISTFVGDKYMGVKDGKLIGVKKLKDANMFDVGVPEGEERHRNTIELMPWILGKRYVTTYNSLGDEINIEIPVRMRTGPKSSLTVIKNVILKGATSNPVFEIMSAQRRMCYTLDTNTEVFSLQDCSNGANDLQTFKFVSYQEALENEKKQNSGILFSIKNYLWKTNVPGTPLLVGDKSGVIYS